MPGVGVCATFDLSGKHGQKRLGSVQCLDLRFLVYAQYYCICRRIEIEPDDVNDLLYEERIGGKCERTATMLFQPKTPPDLVDRRW